MPALSANSAEVSFRAMRCWRSFNPKMSLMASSFTGQLSTLSAQFQLQFIAFQFVKGTRFKQSEYPRKKNLRH